MGESASASCDVVRRSLISPFGMIMAPVGRMTDGVGVGVGVVVAAERYVAGSNNTTDTIPIKTAIFIRCISFS